LTVLKWGYITNVINSVINKVAKDGVKVIRVSFKIGVVVLNSHQRDKTDRNHPSDPCAKRNSD